jgi:ATP-dependent helicase Lhr and Lhr-like helicase
MSTGLLHPRVATAFYGQFTDLRPVQAAAIAPLVGGQNVVLSSSTGSGKTEAVVAPLTSRYWELAAKSGLLYLLYIAPTKALVNDLEKRLGPPLRSLGLRVGIRHGDRDDLASGMTPAILITTPESLEVLIFRRDGALASVKAVVIDEVHLLYNTQRGLQLSTLIRRLSQLTAHQVQWAALSATIGQLAAIRDFLFGANAQCTFLEGKTTRAIDALVKRAAAPEAFVSIINRMLGGGSGKLLVFANSRRQCEELASSLQSHSGLQSSVFAHYSSLSPELRVEAERAFAKSQTAICIATSTLELGIDIGDIDAVLLWGAPPGVESFLQRIGRGNRRSNKTNVVCLIPPDSSPLLEAIRFLALIQAARQSELPVQRPFDLFGAVAQQCLSAIACDGGRFTRIADLCTLFDHLPHVTRPEVEAVLGELAGGGYLQRHGFKNQYGADEQLHKLVDYRMIYGNFGAGSDSIKVQYKSKFLGEVPAVNLLRLGSSTVVRFAGKNWVVQKATRDGITLLPAARASGAVDFVYPGKGPPTDAFIPNRMWRLLHEDEAPMDVLSRELRDGASAFRSYLRSCCAFHQIPCIRADGGTMYFTFAGYLVNKAVGLSLGNDFKADELTLWSNVTIDWAGIGDTPEAFEAVFPSLFEVSSDLSIYQSMLPLELQLREFLQIWLKDETVRKALLRLRASTSVAVHPGFLTGAVLSK